MNFYIIFLEKIPYMKNESRVKTQWAHPLRVRWIYGVKRKIIFLSIQSKIMISERKREPKIVSNKVT